MRIVLWAAAAAVAGASGAVAQSDEPRVVLGSAEAERCYRAALRPNPADTMVELCDTALAAARDDADRAANFVNRGVMRLKRGELTQAREDYEAAAALDPENGEALINLGNVLLRVGDAARAADVIARGLALRPNRPHWAHYNHGLALETLGDRAGAEAAYARAAALQPNYPAPAEALARLRAADAG